MKTNEIIKYLVDDHNINIENSEFIQKMINLSNTEEAQLIFNLKSKQLKKKKTISFFGFIGRISSVQYWVTRGWDESKLNEHQCKVSKVAIEKGSHKGRFSKEWFKKKYGSEEGIKKFNDLKKDRSIKNKKEYQVNKYGLDFWNERMDSKKQTRKNFIKRYGESVGRVKFNEFVEKSKNTVKTFMGRYGEVEGLQKWDEYIQKLKFRNTLEAWQIKFGVDEGKVLWDEFMLTTLGKGNTFSKISEKLFDDIVLTFDKEEKYYYGMNEIIIPCENRRFKPDFVCGHKIIEFYGDFWHANPNKYKGDDEMRFPGRNEILASLSRKLRVGFNCSTSISGWEDG